MLWSPSMWCGHSGRICPGNGSHLPMFEYAAEVDLMEQLAEGVPLTCDPASSEAGFSSSISPTVRRSTTTLTRARYPTPVLSR
jgi:hypothetical protein